jgi:hypothetical protein
VSFSSDGLDTSAESAEIIERVSDNCFTLSRLQENSARFRLQPRSLPRSMASPRTLFSPLEIPKANIAPKSNKSLDIFTKEICLNIRPKELGLKLFLNQNAELPFLPEVGDENALMYLTPISSQSLTKFSSPPVHQRSEARDLHAASLAMHSRLFVPDDF